MMQCEHGSTVLENNAQRGREDRENAIMRSLVIKHNQVSGIWKEGSLESLSDELLVKVLEI